MKLPLLVLVSTISLAALGSSMISQTSQTKRSALPTVSPAISTSPASNQSAAQLPRVGTPPPRREDGCAGEWTRAVATINDPEHNNTMVIRRAANVQDAVRRAHQCRSDVGTVTFFDEGARLACAPYIACDTN